MNIKNHLYFKRTNELLESERLLNNFIQVAKIQNLKISIDELDLNKLCFNYGYRKEIFKSYQLELMYKVPNTSLSEYAEYHIDLKINGEIRIYITKACTESEKEVMKRPFLDFIDEIRVKSQYPHLYDLFLNKITFDFNKFEIENDMCEVDTFLWNDTSRKLCEGFIDFEKFGFFTDGIDTDELEVDKVDIRFYFLRDIKKLLSFHLYSNEIEGSFFGIDIIFYNEDLPLVFAIETHDLTLKEEIDYKDLVEYATSKNISLNIDNTYHQIDISNVKDNIDDISEAGNSVLSELEKVLEVIQFKEQLELKGEKS